MTSSVIFFSTTDLDSKSIVIPKGCVLFHGIPVDDRGTAATRLESSNIQRRVPVEYDYDLMTIKVDGTMISADQASTLVKPIIEGKNVIFESTTLGFAELFLLVQSMADLGVNRFKIIYVEPKEYSRTKPGADSFALSELNAGYRPIPRSVVDLAGDDVEAGVFFLGFEPERLERAFEEYQMIAHKDIKVVFGIPAFHPGWELNSIVPHLKSIDNCDVQYCAANDPGSAYDALEVTRSSLSLENKMFVAPLGTKPCGIAAALFASAHSGQVGLLFDHRKKMSKRSRGVGVWHSYSILIKS